MTDADILRLLSDDRLVRYDGWWIEPTSENEITASSDTPHAWLSYSAETIHDALEGLVYALAYDWWETVFDDEDEEVTQ